MKKELLALLISLFLMQLVACERSKMEEDVPAPSGARTGSENDSDGTPRIETAKTTGIQQKEPTLFTLVDPASPYVKWQTIPVQTIENRGIQGVIYFQKAGKYRVFAIDSVGTDTAFVDVEVTEEVYSPDNYKQAIQAGDELLVTPRTFADSANYLDMRLTTRNNYRCVNGQLRFDRTQNGTSYECKIAHVDLPMECFSGEGKASAWWFVDGEVPAGASGEIRIDFGGKTYKGTYKRQGKNYTFDWPYESGVIFTTKSI